MTKKDISVPSVEHHYELQMATLKKSQLVTAE